jgi:murein DD-endopeptidase MepM/ murein hydrolase activator NlpD
MALCVSLLFLGGRHPQASVINTNTEMVNWIWPADGVISDTFGSRNGKHKGIDIAGELNTPIIAVDNAVVEKSYFSNSYGNVIFLKHPNNYVSVYAHLSERLAFEGQTVQRGDRIGKMGATGQATGVHLHFETHKSEWTFDKRYALDPENLLGKAIVGDVVQAGSPSNDKNVLEASSRLSPRDNSDGDNHDFYIVKNKDTLWSIALSNNMTIESLQNLNGIVGTNIYIGEKLMINKKSEHKYIIKQGDTLTSISQENHFSVGQIKQLNHLSSDIIRPNQILVLPQSNE